MYEFFVKLFGGCNGGNTEIGGRCLG